MENKLFISTGIFVAFAAAVLFWTYTRAEGNEITACVRKDGIMHLVGNGFKRTTCVKTEELITWNIQGPKGEKGEKGDQGEQGSTGPQGEPGEPAQHGAGNIAFIFQDKVLKTNGTVWAAYHGNVPFTQLGSVDPCRDANGVGNVPIPVEDIVDWNYNNLLDKNGGYWFINTGNLCRGWMNFGQLP